MSTNTTNPPTAKLKFRLPIFGIKIKVYYTDNVIARANKLGFEVEPPVVSLVDTTDEAVVFILNNNYPVEATLMHESLHGAWRAMDQLGIPVNESTEEVLAYLQEYIYDYILENLL